MTLRVRASAVLAFVAVEALGLSFASVRLNTYKRGETILGEEFIAATEQVVDYLATLPRPASGYSPYKFTCEAKTRYIRPSVYTSPMPPAGEYSSVEIRTVYDIKDCVQLSD